MTKINIAGTAFSSFQIGKKGPIIFQGSTVPISSLGANGDIYIQTNTANTFQKISGEWVSLHSKSWTFQFYIEKLSANSVVDAIVGAGSPKNVSIFRTGIVLASSIVVLAPRTAGNIIARVTLNDVVQNGAGQNVRINASAPKSNSTILSPPIIYNVNDYLGVRVTTNSYAPMNQPATINLFCQDI